MKIRKAVIPVAGKGTRFLPATKQVPKEMIPILGKPMIQFVVEEAVRSGIEQVIFVTSHGKEMIEEYFDYNRELERFLEDKGKEEELALCRQIGGMIEVVSVRQKEQLGLGHAVLCAEKLVGDESFAVLLGDDIVLGDVPATKQLMDVSASRNGAPVIGVMEIDPKDSTKYGIVEGEFIDPPRRTLKMRGMVEKPRPENAPTNLATPGRYILTPGIFGCLRSIPRGVGGEYQLTDAICKLAMETDVFAHLFIGERFDTGTVECHLRAIVDFALRDPQYRRTMEEIIVDKVKKYGIALR